MTRSVHIFIPELVPLENKGEEAIVRGIADVLFPDGNCEIHLFDEVDEYRHENGIHVYPVSWFISPWLNREFGLGASWEKIRDSFSSLVRNALHVAFPKWVASHCGALRRSARTMRALHDGQAPSCDRDRRLLQILNCDYVVVGHDGALDERVCQVVDLMQSFGKQFGVFGVEFPTRFKSEQIESVMRNTLQHAEFFFCRTPASRDAAMSVFPEGQPSYLPDPAFGMKPAEDDEASALIEQAGLGELFNRPVIVCTSCEPGPISRHCFEEAVSPGARLEAHRRLYAELIKHIVATVDANVLFLPHAIGPGVSLDDRRVARSVLDYAGVPEDRARLLNSVHDAKLLKAIIGRGEFLIAERIHSMIGAVGVATPFLCLGSNTDRRIKGIIEDTAEMGDSIYYLNSPVKGELIDKFESTWKRRDEVRSRLDRVRTELWQKLSLEAEGMRERILHASSDAERAGR